jgi:hypothetical protein
MDTLASLDEEVAALANDASEERRAIGPRRNALTPLGRLPEEVLIEIAGLLMLPGRLFAGLSEYNVAQVCGGLRSIIINTPNLWAYIDLNRSVRWCKLCVERAGSTALSLSYHPLPLFGWPQVWSPKEYEARETLFTQLLSRAACLKVKLPRSQVQSCIVNDMFGSSWPLVHSLDLGETNGYHTPCLNQAVFPSLTTLTCVNPWFAFDGVEFSTLKHLDIRRITWHSGSHGSLSVVWNLIRRAPNLRSLVVSDDRYNREPNETILSPLSPSHLRYLDTVLLITEIAHSACPTPQLVTLFQALRMPRLECTVRFGDVWGKACNFDVRKSALQAILRNPVLHIRRDGWKHSVAYTENRAGALLTVDHALASTRSFTYLESAPPCVKTLHVGENTAAYVFRCAVGRRALFPAVEHVIIEDAQTDYTYFKQWLQARVSAGRRLPVLEFRTDLIDQSTWEDLSIQSDVAELGLAEVVVLADGTRISTDVCSH